MTLEEIHEALAVDHRPTGADGCSNADRLSFISQVFGLEELDLTLPYDFTTVMDESDPVIIAAVQHLAFLKLDYLNRLYDHGHVDRATYDSLSAPLILSIQRIGHHLHFAEQGLPTPPFSAF